MENKLYNLGVEKITPINLGADWCGIYFLFDDEELVYIGKGANVYARIGTHKKNDIKFNGASYYQVANEQKRDVLEAKLIWELRPKYNKQIINPAIIRLRQLKRANGKTMSESYVDLKFITDGKQNQNRIGG